MKTIKPIVVENLFADKDWYWGTHWDTAGNGNLIILKKTRGKDSRVVVSLVAEIKDVLWYKVYFANCKINSDERDNEN